MCLAVLGAWFGYANPLLHVPIAIALLPAGILLGASRASTKAQAFRYSFLAAWPAYTASLYWIALPVHDYGGLPWILALPCPFLVGAVVAGYAGLFGLGIFSLGTRRNSGWAVLASCGLWATLEVLRNVLLTGFSWLTLSSALAPWPEALGLAAWIGGFGLSGVIVGMVYAVVCCTRYTRLWAVGLMLFCALPWALRTPAPAQALVSAVLVQGNIDQNQKWEPELQADILDAYLTLTRQAASRIPDLIIWPETAMPFYFQDRGVLPTLVTDTVRSLGIPLVAGSPAYSRPDHGPEYILHNRAYVFAKDGSVLSWYDKEHLVPFGEYVPLGQWLPFISKLVPGAYEFGPGHDQHPLATGQLTLGMLICYEAIFPELAQNQVAKGANILVNISNDAWFGRSSAPLQHLHLAVLRAVEQNRFLLRATNTGISALIDPYGHIRTQGPSFVPDLLLCSDIELLTATTFYHDHFHAIHLGFALMSCMAWTALRLAGQRLLSTTSTP
ncbi:apolipoprotein N-acyltransferase [Desulfovibrionales bacterium]